MLELLWLIPILPFASFLTLALFGHRLSRTGIALIGVGFAAVSAVLAILIAFAFISSPPPGYVFSQTLWEWISVAGFTAGISLYLDPLALIFTFVVSFVGFFILLYSVAFMFEEEGYSRFFACMNLFIGYMFLALGVGAWSTGVFHFMTHAFFKALLFLGAGVVIFSMHHEHNMFKMGGLRRQLPLTFWTFLIGAGSLAAFPLITAGFYSKDSIIWYAWSSERGGIWLYLAALAGALLTAMYTFRMVFVTFFGEAKGAIAHKLGRMLELALIVLAVLSVIGGFVELPRTLGRFTPFTDFLDHALPAVRIRAGASGQEGLFEIISIAVSLFGLYLAYVFFLRRRDVAERFTRIAVGRGMSRFFFAGWGFDWLYEKNLVQPYVWISNINRDDVIDFFYRAIAWLARRCHAGLSATETGQVRLYAAVIAAGAMIVIALAVFL
jgi:NADH-quinone oxidoreductase subunit L